MREQGFLCAYTMMPIKERREKCHIEHIKPQRRHPELADRLSPTWSYCASGGDGAPRCTFGAHAKGDADVSDEDFVSPLRSVLRTTAMLRGRTGRRQQRIAERCGRACERSKLLDSQRQVSDCRPRARDRRALSSASALEIGFLPLEAVGEPSAFEPTSRRPVASPSASRSNRSRPLTAGASANNAPAGSPDARRIS